MDPVVIAAIIGAVGTITAAIITVWVTKRGTNVDSDRVSARQQELNEMANPSRTSERAAEEEQRSNLRQQMPQLATQNAQNFYGQSIGRIKSQVQNYRSQLEQYSQQVSEGDAQAQIQEMVDSYIELESSIDLAAQDMGVEDQMNQAMLQAQKYDATEAAKQMAEELGVDLSHVQGSGAGGRITVRDVQAAANQSEGRPWWQR